MGERKKQQYHLEPDRGLLNDPNGLSWFRGKYHVFFQWNRFEKNHSYKEWGLFTSENLTEWKFEGSALLPDQEYERDGVYSGTGCVIEEQLHLFYTGNSRRGGKRRSSQCLAVTEDGRTFEKKGIVLETPQEYTEHFRDPKVFRGKASDYFMLLGAQQKNGKGALALCHSGDGLHWDYRKMLAVSEQYQMVECPDFFELEGWQVILFCLQKRDNRRDLPIQSFAAYKLECFCEEQEMLREKVLEQGCRNLDEGFDFYAPQTFESPDGRRILFAWMAGMTEEQEEVFSRNEPNIHCLTLPRELFIQKEQLCQRPARELYRLLGEPVPLELKDGSFLASLGGRAFCLHLRDIEGKQDLLLSLHQGEFQIKYLQAEKRLMIIRKNWMTGWPEKKSIQTELLEELELWADQSSVELFVNGGETVCSARVFPNSRKLEIEMTGAGEKALLEVREIRKVKKKEETGHE